MASRVAKSVLRRLNWMHFLLLLIHNRGIATFNGVSANIDESYCRAIMKRIDGPEVGLALLVALDVLEKDAV